MDAILKKMTWKEGMNIQVWNTPDELQDLINSWKNNGLIDSKKNPDFMLAFVQTEDEVKKYFFEMQALATEDQQIWMAYPKGSSKRYKSTVIQDGNI